MFSSVCHCDSSSPGPRDSRRSASGWWVWGDFYKKNTTQSRLQLHVWVWVMSPASSWMFCSHHGAGKQISSNTAEEKQSRAVGQGKFVAEESMGPAATVGSAVVSSALGPACTAETWVMERTGCSTRACQGRSPWKSPSDGWLLFSTWDGDIFSMACPAGSDPWVLSSHIPVLASCCSLTKLNPPLKVPDALGPHTCLAPLGTCSPCPHTCSAPVMALQTWDSSYAPSFHLSQIFCPNYFFSNASK